MNIMFWISICSMKTWWAITQVAESSSRRLTPEIRWYAPWNLAKNNNSGVDEKVWNRIIGRAFWVPRQAMTCQHPPRLWELRWIGEMKEVWWCLLHCNRGPETHKRLEKVGCIITVHQIVYLMIQNGRRITGWPIFHLCSTAIVYKIE